MTHSNQLINLIEQQSHPSWHPFLLRALKTIPEFYQDYLFTKQDWLPGQKNFLKSFSLPFNEIKYVIYGESPYPRKESANGYAFWDASVKSIWGPKGLSKEVNRATSLRNFIKMLLLANQFIKAEDLSSSKIVDLEKKNLVQTLDDLFIKMLKNGFLLLNASLSLTSLGKQEDSKAYLAFQNSILATLKSHSDIKLILFGKLAEKIINLPEAQYFDKLVSEHPYNISFIYNKEVQRFFRNFNLLAQVVFQ